MEKRLEKACCKCGKKEGELDFDGAPVKLEEHEGEAICTVCLEVLAYVQRWV